MKRPSATHVLLAIVAVLLGRNLVDINPAAVQAAGTDIRRCCLPTNGQCLDIDFTFCIAIGGSPGAPGSSCSEGECGPGACCVGSVCLVVFDGPSCAQQGGVYQGWSSIPMACVGVECLPCPADVDGDGTVGILDFLDLLAAWGDCK